MGYNKRSGGSRLFTKGTIDLCISFSAIRTASCGTRPPRNTACTSSVCPMCWTAKNFIMTWANRQISAIFTTACAQAPCPPLPPSTSRITSTISSPYSPKGRISTISHSRIRCRRPSRAWTRPSPNLKKNIRSARSAPSIPKPSAWAPAFRYATRRKNTAPAPPWTSWTPFCRTFPSIPWSTLW